MVNPKTDSLEVTMSLPVWAADLLVCPGTGSALRLAGDTLRDESGQEAGRIDQGLVRFPIADESPDARYYRGIGGAHFYERRDVPLAMSALDTFVYQDLKGHLDGFKSGVVLDLGGGDGRNAWPLLDAGFAKLIVTDVAGEALLRFRRRLEHTNPDHLERVLFVECDARQLPIKAASLDAALAIEVLAYLNEDYGSGVREIKRCLRPRGVAFISEHDWAASLITRVLYKGLAAMLKNAECRESWDGVSGATVRARSFTVDELIEMFETAGFEVRYLGGVPLLSAVIGFLNGLGRLEQPDHDQRAALSHLMKSLSCTSAPFRCNMIQATSC